MPPLRFAEFQLLSFDCYGTMIDWETGILSALRPILSAHGKSIADADLLALYGELEAEAEQGAFRPYREVLQSVVRSLGKKFWFTPTEPEARSLPESLKSWKPFPDTIAALGKLKQRYKLAVISNVDDDLFAATATRLRTAFDFVITAQQAGAYKPSRKIFNLAQEKIGVSPGQWLHVGQSIYHDVLPAQSLGLSTVWVNRPSRHAGVGAVKSVSGKADLEVPDLQTLANLALADSKPQD